MESQTNQDNRSPTGPAPGKTPNSSTTFPRSPLRIAAIVGAVVWLVLAAAPNVERMAPVEARLIWLGLLVVVPLLLSTVGSLDERPGFLFDGAARILPSCAAIAVASWLFVPSPRAGAFAAAWMVVAGLIGLRGLLRIIERGLSDLHATAVDVGCMYLPAGTVWLLASRFGKPLMGFQEPIVLLTAAHFHFAGFAASVIAGLAGRALIQTGAPRWLLRVHFAITSVVLLGVPLVAVGIAGNPRLETPAAIVLAAAMLGLAAILVGAVGPRLRRHVGGSQGNAIALFFAISALSLVFSMGLAAAFAIGRAWGRPLVSIPRMAELHGTANAVGFALCAALGFAIAAAKPSPKKAIAR